MEGFKNSTRMKTFGDEAPSCYAKGGSVKPAAKVGKVMGEFAAGKLHSGSKKGPEVTSRKQAIAIGISEAKKAGVMKKAGGGNVSKMSPADRRASAEQPSRAMTALELRAAKAMATAKAAAPKQGPLIKPVRQMSPADRRLIEMDRPTSASGSSEYKKGGKVGASKVPFLEKKTGEKYASKGAMAKHERGESLAVKRAEGEIGGKKVMRKAMGGAVAMPEMPNDYAPPSPPMAATDYQPQVMPMQAEQPPLENMSRHNDMLREAIAYRDAQAAQAQQMQQMQQQRDAAQIRREAASRFMR